MSIRPSNWFKTVSILKQFALCGKTFLIMEVVLIIRDWGLIVLVCINTMSYSQQSLKSALSLSKTENSDFLGALRVVSGLPNPCLLRHSLRN